ncbi:MAG: CBS domain-containing protein [Treponema sp.]|jgi:acetoin utilization protein AcuB|nr:CBS domain-containing protein [Treponema sp.]
MIIDRVMAKNPFFINPDMPINDVRSLMQKEKVGHLPVLDKSNALVGLVTKKDLLQALPSSATSLDMYEISYLISKMTAKDVMVKSVITVTENEVVEEAARIMADNEIGCLPVMRDKLLVGIITDTDLFRVFLKAFGVRSNGVRVTCIMKEKPGELARLTHAIAEKGGNIVALVTSEMDELSQRLATIKISGFSRDDAQALFKSFEIEVEDIRE